MSEYIKAIEDIAKELIPLLCVLVASLFTIRSYFRQKEHEQVRKRFLDDGLDIIIQQTESCLHLFQTQYTRCFLILKTFRDFGKDTPAKAYQEPFTQPHPDAIASTRHYLLQRLIHDKIFYKGSQLLMVFLLNAINTFENDLCSAVNLYIHGSKELKVPSDRTEIVAAYQSKLEELDKDVKKFWNMLGLLKSLASVLDQREFTFHSIQHFHKLKAVKEIVEKAKTQFKEELTRLEQEKKSPTIASSLRFTRGGQNETEA